ncbi:MAG: cell division protein FtsQ/DivIB [Bacteroidaceae bacterium]
MVKKILILLFILLLGSYLLFAMSSLSESPRQAICKGVEVTLMENQEKGFIKAKDIENILKARKLFPIGKEIRLVNTRQLEQILNQHPLIEHSECYKTSDQKIVIQIYQRIPILRVISDTGEEYYIDTKGALINSQGENEAYLPIVTGAINKKVAGKVFLPIGLFLRDDPYWANKIEQIHLTPQGELEAAPSEGEFLIYMGPPSHFKEKLERLRKFYDRALNKIGWDKYSRINIEYNNQIICTKKEK